MYTDPSLIALERALDQLAPLKPNNAVVTETYFKENILPIIANYTPDMETSAWIKTTGTYDRGIDVYEDNTENLLFSVPPMFTGFEVQSPTSNENSISKIVEDYKEMINRMPAIADNMLRNKLQGRVLARELSIEQVAALEKIRDRYKIKLQGIAESTSTKMDYDSDEL